MSYHVFFPSYTIGADAYDKIPEICGRYGKKAVLIGGKTALTKVQGELTAVLKTGGFDVLAVLWYGGDCSEENAAALKETAAVQEADMIFGIGGGRALDTCKIVAHELGKTLFTVPTIASTCAAATAISVTYHADGSFNGVHLSKVSANHIFISTKIIAEAPAVYLWAGIGDTLAKHYEATVSTRFLELAHSDALGISISPLCAEPLLTYGEQAMADCRQHKASYAFEQTVLSIIISTGLVSLLLTKQDYNTGLAHAIYFGLVALAKHPEKHLHGEIVAYGVLVLLMLDQQKETLARVYRFAKSIGLPTRLEDLDVTTAEDITTVIRTAASMPDVQAVWPYPVSEASVRAAVMALEDYSLAK